MKYSTQNCTISFSLQLADFLRSRGYDIYWNESGVLEEQTAGLPEALDTVTLVEEFPAEKTYIVDVEDRSTLAPGQVAIPALCLTLPTGPERLRRTGLGDAVHLRRRLVLVDGFASGDAQWKALADVLHDFACGGREQENGRRTDVYLSVQDFDMDAEDPPELPPVHVEWGEVERLPQPGEPPPLEKYIKLTFAVHYHE
jgi:hypothetical protein